MKSASRASASVASLRRLSRRLAGPTLWIAAALLGLLMAFSAVARSEEAGAAGGGWVAVAAATDPDDGDSGLEPDPAASRGGAPGAESCRNPPPRGSCQVVEYDVLSGACSYRCRE